MGSEVKLDKSECAMRIYIKLMFYFLRAFSATVADDEPKGNLDKMQNNAETTTESCKGGTPMTLTRRNKPSVANAANINDPQFQEMLNKYRGMVGQYQPNQAGLNRLSQGRSTNVIDLSYGRYGAQTPVANYKHPGDLLIPQYHGPTVRIPAKYVVQWTPTQPALRHTAEKEPYKPGAVKGHQPHWGGITRQGFPGDDDFPGNRPIRTTAAPTTKRFIPGIDDGQNDFLPGRPTSADMPPEGFPEGVDPSNLTEGDAAKLPPGFSLSPEDLNKAAVMGITGAANRFTTKKTPSTRRARSTPVKQTFEEHCDYIAYYCIKAYDTSPVCGRMTQYKYHTFDNYCMMDYVNCRERYDIWQVAHMGECFDLKILTEFLHYPYMDDYFLDQYYVIEDAL